MEAALPCGAQLVCMDERSRDIDYPIETVPTPDTDDGPERALQRQIAALERNDDPIADAGIKTVYNYASPANRRRTGPYERFARMVRSDRYAPLVDHAEAVPGPVEKDRSLRSSPPPPARERLRRGPRAARTGPTGPSGRTARRGPSVAGWPARRSCRRS